MTKYRHSTLYINILFIGAVLFSGCFSPTKKSGQETEVIIVSILPLQYMVERIAGNDFETLVAVPPGANPETFEPSPSLMRTFADCDLFFHTGLIDFENILVRGTAYEEEKAVNLSEGLPLLTGECGQSHDDHTHSHGHGTDPHIWLSPSRVKNMVLKITDKLCSVRPENADVYRTNYDNLISSIDSLDNHIREVLAPADRRGSDFLIYHPFLAYFSADYGLNQIALETDGKEPTAGHFKTVVQRVREKELTTVFYQEQFSRTSVDAIASELDLDIVSLDPLAYDWMTNMKDITYKIHRSLQR